MVGTARSERNGECWRPLADSRMQQPPPDAKDHCPRCDVDGKEDDDPDQQDAEPQNRSRCSQAQHGTNGKSFDAILRGSCEGAHKHADGNEDW